MAVVSAARERTVGLYPMERYRAAGRARPAAPPQIVMGFGNVNERAIEPAIGAIADLLS
jgi:GntR family transcriptional regulator/MocR family aminotransferase